MITVRLKLSEAYESALEAIKANPGYCDEIWLTTPFGYPDISVHEKTARELKEAALIFKARGVRVCLQLSNSIGHGEMNSGYDCSGLDGAEHMTGADGLEASGCFCARGTAFLEYSRAVIGAYAGICADTLWIDDDLRPELHAPVDYGCFCPNCLEKFNAKYGSRFTREALAREINFGDAAWRVRWAEFVREGLYDYTKMLSEAASRALPGAQIGYQYVSVSQYTGVGNAYIFDAMREGSGRTPRSRPGYGFYDDAQPLGMIDKAYRVMFCNACTPDYVTDRRAEVENIPGFALGKTLQATLTESTIYLASGCNGLTYASINQRSENAAFHLRTAAGLKAYRPLWERLIEAERGTYASGAALAISERGYERRLSEGEADFAWANQPWGDSLAPVIYGLPVSFDEAHAQLLLLTLNIVRAIPADELKRLQSKNALCSASAMAYLAEIGLCSGIEPVPDNAIREEFSDNKINSEYAGMPFAPFDISGPRFIIKDGAPLSDYFSTRDGRRLGAASAIIDMRDGARWAVIGTALETANISTAMRNMVLRAADEICGGTLPVMIENAERISVFPRVDGDGKLCVATVLHQAMGATEGEIIMRVRNPRGEKFFFMDHKMSAPIEISARKGRGEYELRIPAMDGWDAGIVICE